MAESFADLSHHQGSVDLAAYKRAGHRTIILKATEGVNFVDPAFAARWREAGRQGLRRVAYHYARNVNSGASEFDFFIRAVDAAGGLGPDDLLCLDSEDTQTPARARGQASEFTHRGADTGHPVGWLYTGNWYANPNRLTPEVLPVGWRRLWLSNYDGSVPDDQVRVPVGWDRSALYARQFTDRATVPGVGGTCDYSRLLIDWTGEQDMPLSDAEWAKLQKMVDDSRAETLRVIDANLGEKAVNNPKAWVNSGIAARLGAEFARDLAPLLDDEAKLTQAVNDAVAKVPGGTGSADAEVVKAAVRQVLSDVRLSAPEQS